MIAHPWRGQKFESYPDADTPGGTRSMTREPSYPWDYLEGVPLGHIPAWLREVSYDVTRADMQVLDAYNRRNRRV